MTLYAIDIDQTICGSNAHEVYADFHNNDLALHIEDSRLKRLTSYGDFFYLPEVKAFRQSHEAEWNASRHRAIATPSVIEAFTPIEGAVRGIELLSQQGSVRYYTARTPVVRQATECWLAQYGFPASQQVICCGSIEQKIRLLACHEPYDEPVVLIDDRGHTHFLMILERIQQEKTIQALLQRLSILAFGASVDTLPEGASCSLSCLPSWNQLQAVLPCVPAP